MATIILGREEPVSVTDDQLKIIQEVDRGINFTYQTSQRCVTDDTMTATIYVGGQAIQSFVWLIIPDGPTLTKLQDSPTFAIGSFFDQQRGWLSLEWNHAPPADHYVLASYKYNPLGCDDEMLTAGREGN